jgi:acyl dehydratase
LEKATPGTNQPFETTSINNNWDKVDANAASDHNRITAVETLVSGLSYVSGRLVIDGGGA